MSSRTNVHATATRALRTRSLSACAWSAAIALAACGPQHATATNSNAAAAPHAVQTPPAKTPEQATPAPKPVPVDGFEIVATFPHDAKSFTQGLVFHNGNLLESQGEYGRSSLRRVELSTGKVLQSKSVAPEFFAEGIALLKGVVYQLTWREHTGFIYTLGDLQPQARFTYTFEGWGLTTDGEKLIVSDGTSTLRFLDPGTGFKLVKSLTVRAEGKPVDQLNELEWVNGEIWANVWHTDRIARIDPATGDVTRWLDLTGLLPIAEHPGPESVLNGIAWDAHGERIFVTGKFWPKLFEIKVKKKS